MTNEEMLIYLKRLAHSLSKASDVIASMCAEVKGEYKDPDDSYLVTWSKDVKRKKDN